MAESSQPLEAPGLQPRWVVEGVLAVSPMPRPEDLEELARFPTVLSLAGPAEYLYSGGLDPRAEAAAVENFVWLPVGEYNAPPLPRLARALRDAEQPRPVLIHCFRGCGRSSSAAAAWLAWSLGRRASEALAEVATRTGCGVETMPQRSVVEALALTLAAGEKSWLLQADPEDPRPEYAALLAGRLHGLLHGEPTALLQEAARGRGPIAAAAEALAREAGYTVAGIELAAARPPTLRIHTWIPRGAHPAAVPEPRIDPDRVASTLQEALQPSIEGLRVEVKIHPRTRPPWL